MSGGDMKTCMRCKTAKPLDCYGKNARNKDGLQPWCSPCRKEHRDATKVQRAEYQREFTKGYTITRPCDVCGTTFTAQKRTPLVKTCPRLECRHPRTEPPATCDVPWVVCERHGPHIRKCRECMRIKSLRRWVSGTCTVCGEWFMVQDNKLKPLYCSRRCSRSEQKHRRRVLVKDTYGGPVSRAAVFERDDYSCRLCNRPMLMTWDYADGYHPDAPTIDHVVALSNGGVHSMGNVQSAHYLCNSLKSDKRTCTRL